MTDDTPTTLAADLRLRPPSRDEIKLLREAGSRSVRQAAAHLYDAEATLAVAAGQLAAVAEMTTHAWSPGLRRFVAMAETPELVAKRRRLAVRVKQVQQQILAGQSAMDELAKLAADLADDEIELMGRATA